MRKLIITAFVSVDEHTSTERLFKGDFRPA
jgi:hypothetical protein